MGFITLQYGLIYWEVRPPKKALVVDSDDYPLPPHVIRWPSKSPGRASNPPLATEEWLSPTARTLNEKGPVFLATSECLLNNTLDPHDWLPAFGAHSIPGFAREHILPLQAPEVIPDFGFRVASPLLEKEHMKALECLKSLIASAEDDWQVKRRRQRPSLLASQVRVTYFSSLPPKPFALIEK